jgi:hypothetical protein
MLPQPTTRVRPDPVRPSAIQPGASPVSPVNSTYAPKEASMPRRGGRPSRTKRMGLAGALLLAVALPVAAPSAASAYPGYTFSITCQGPGAGKVNWSWWQGGLYGTDLAAASAICPTGGGTTSGTGVQPATADTLYAVVSADSACGFSTHTWSFPPGSSISVKLSDSASGSCGGYKNGGNEKADWALQS